MATAKEMKARLRSFTERCMNDFRENRHRSSIYTDFALGAVWAASHADAISDKERKAYLDELLQTNQQHGQPAPMQRAA